MSFSSLYKFLLKLKGRGHFLSPKEVQFLKELLKEFSEEDIKATFERCFKELLPPEEREKSSLLRCKKLFQKRQKVQSKVYLQTEHQQPSTVKEVLNGLEPQLRKKVINELKETLKKYNLPPTKENIKMFLQLIVRRYL